VEGEAYSNPEFLKEYAARGSALHLGDGERKSVRVEVIPAEEQP
jgi:hypothetical protein